MKETDKSKILFRKEAVLALLAAGAIMWLLGQDPASVSNPINGPLPTPVSNIK